MLGEYSMSQTSKAAYQKLNPTTVLSEEGQILAYMYDAGCPVNDREISMGTGLARNVTWSRRCSLVKRGKLVFAGVRFDAHTANCVQTWKLKTTSKDKQHSGEVT
jgi:hypothetical protein